MNILFLFWGRKGGGARYSYEISRELNKRDDVNLFLSVSNQCDLIDQFKGLNSPSLFIDTYESAFGFIKKWIFQRKSYLKQLTMYLKKNEIDLIIIGMDFFWGGIIYKAAKAANVKTIYVAHEPKPHPKEPFFIGMVMKWTLRTLITKADYLITLTDHVKSYLINKYKIKESKISVIPHGIFSYYNASGPKKLAVNERVKILYFGTIAYYKGLDILLKAFSILEKKYKFIQLEVWGSGDISEYQTLIDDLKNIRIENRWISESEIENIFKQSHICVLPYREASQSGIVGVAGSAAMPIVACPADGLKEQTGETVIAFSKDFTPESLSESIEKLLLSPAYYSTQSKKILTYTDRFSWSAIASAFKNVGDQLIKKNDF